jgi:peroxiredoxin
MSQLAVGQQAPDFELYAIKGQSCRLSDALTRGPVALIFYKSACPTCQFTFPYVQKMFSKMGGTTDRTIWGISQDDPDETRQFAADAGIRFDLLIDEHPYEVSSAYGLEFVPALFLIRPPNDGLPATRPG